MSIYHNPQIPGDGLFTIYDFKNKKTYSSAHNLVSYSTYNASTWSIINPDGWTGATVATNIADPFGGTDAVRVTGAGYGSYLLRVSIPSFTPNGTSSYTVSFYARLISGSTSLSSDLNDGISVGNYFPQLVTNQWVRISYTGIPSATAMTFVDVVSNTVNTAVVDYYGLQVEQNSYVSEYVHTSGTIVPKSTVATDIAKLNNLVVYGNPQLNQNGHITLGPNQTTQYLMNSRFPIPAEDITVSILFKPGVFTVAQTPFTYSVAGNNEMLFFLPNSTTIQPHIKNSGAWQVTVPDMVNQWVHIVWTRDYSSGVNKLYRNGIEAGTFNFGANISLTKYGYLIFGQESDAPGGGFDPNQNLNGDIAYFSVHERVLSDQEISSMFDLVRGRYGL